MIIQVFNVDNILILKFKSNTPVAASLQQTNNFLGGL